MAQDIFLRPAAVKIYIYQTFNSCSVAHLAFKTRHFFSPFKEDKGKDRWEFKKQKARLIRIFTVERISPLKKCHAMA